MGRGDLPILARQWLLTCIEGYRTSSLYHRNLGFFFFGIIGGSVWGSYKRKTNEERNADYASVNVTFYELPPALPPQQQTKGSLQVKESKPLITAPQKRAFEKLWGEAARLLQRQPGYTYTIMFRRVASAEEDEDVDHKRPAAVELQERRGVGAGCETPGSGASCRRVNPALEYVEMRVWENAELQQKAKTKQMHVLQKMQELGVKMSEGLYRRVFDDALVRLIQ